MRASTAIGLHSRKGGVTRSVIVTASVLVAILAYALFTPIVAVLLADFLQTAPALTLAQVEELKTGGPAAIVILSAGRRTYAPEFGAQTLDELSLERVRYGARLARQTNLPVLVSGGLGKGSMPTLAALLAVALEQDYGIAARWQEAMSSNTYENAQFASAILKQQGIERVVLVTHAWHMKRAAAAFAAQGVTVIPAPTSFYRRRSDWDWREFLPGAGAFQMSTYALHEIFGDLWYRVRYKY